MAFIEHEGKRRDLGRVVGGIGWPSDKPGYAVIVAEELYSRSGERMRRVHLLEEIVDVPVFGELLTRCAELARKLSVEHKITVEGFFARIDELIGDQFLAWKKRQREDFWITRASNSTDDGLISYHANLLVDRAKDGNLHLSLSDQFQLKGRLHEIQEGEIATAKDTQFPAVAALGYAVAYLTDFEPLPDNDEEIRSVANANMGRDPTTGY